MADSVTSTKSAKAADPTDEINKHLDAAKAAMVASGMPEDEADAMLNAARPNSPGAPVGNIADLQRQHGAGE